jgi:uncharacterized protein (UPF0335 family)
MNIQQLVAQNKLKEAIALIPDENERTIIAGRLTTLEKKINFGIINYENQTIEHNRICQAILYHAKEANNNTTMQINSLEDALNTIVRDNKRRRSELALKAEQYLKIWREYTDEKKRTPAFDIAGRRLKVITDSINEFLNSLNEAQKDDLEAIVARVTKLIDPAIPSWDAINEAYTLLVGRGFIDKYISENIKLQPNDNEAKIRCAESIEEYLTKIS